jgi:hypothetical protein
VAGLISVTVNLMFAFVVAIQSEMVPVESVPPASGMATLVTPPTGLRTAAAKTKALGEVALPEAVTATLKVLVTVVDPVSDVLTTIVKVLADVMTKSDPDIYWVPSMVIDEDAVPASVTENLMVLLVDAIQPDTAPVLSVPPAAGMATLVTPLTAFEVPTFKLIAAGAVAGDEAVGVDVDVVDVALPPEEPPPHAVKSKTRLQQTM